MRTGRSVRVTSIRNNREAPSGKFCVATSIRDTCSQSSSEFCKAFYQTISAGWSTNIIFRRNTRNLRIKCCGAKASQIKKLLTNQGYPCKLRPNRIAGWPLCPISQALMLVRDTTLSWLVIFVLPLSMIRFALTTVRARIVQSKRTWRSICVAGIGLS